MIPNFQSFFLPLLNLISDKKEHAIRDTVSQLADHFKLSQEERNEMLSSQSQRTVDNRVYWANTYLKKAGLIESPRRGVIVISKRGENVLAQKPAEINNAFLRQFPEFIEFQKVNKKNNDDTPATQTNNNDSQQDPFSVITDAFETINKTLADDLLELIQKKNELFFERLVVELLVKMGYSNEDSSLFLTKITGDEGLDGIIKMDKLGFDRIGVQAKKWAKDVGQPEIRDFAGALGGKGIKNGVFFTTSSFSRPAREYKHEGIKIVLIDGKELAKQMITYNVGVQKNLVVELKKIDLDFFEEF